MQRPPDHTAADHAFARFVATGSPRAMAELFDVTAGELLLLARRLVRDSHDAEDLVQQTYLQVIRAASTWRREAGPVGAWMTAILVNEARSRRRAEARRRRREAVRSVGVDACDRGAGPDQVAERRELQQTVQRLLDELPAAHRDAVAMRVCHGMPPRLIARALGLPVETVKTRIKRGLRELEGRLPRHLALGGVVVARNGLSAVRRSVVDAARVSVGSTGLAAASGLAAAALGVVGMTKLYFGAVLAVIVGVLWITWGEAPRAAGADSPSEVPDALHARSEGSTAGGDHGASTQRSVVGDVEELQADAIEGTVSVLVRAVWSPSGEPAVDVPMTLLVQPSRHLDVARTDAAGECRFELAGEETASIECGLLPRRYFPAGTGSSEPMVVEIEEGLRIRGRVVDGSRRAVAGAEVAVRHGDRLTPAWIRARSGPDGWFDLRGLGESFALRAWSGSASSPEIERGQVVAALESGGLELVLTESGQSVELEVVTPAGVPVAGALVQMLPPRSVPDVTGFSSFTTDARGVARWGGVRPGSYRVEVAHGAHPPGLLQLEVSDQDPVTRRVVLGPAISVRGRVRRPDGEPLVGVRVETFGSFSLFHGGVHSDDEGTFRLENLSPGRWEIAAAIAGESRRMFLELSAEDAGRDREFEIVMGAALPIRGVLVDANGLGVPHWNVRARRHVDFDGGLFARTDRDGNFEIPAARPQSSYRVEVLHPGGHGHHVFHGVEPADAGLVYRLPAGAVYEPASLRGRIVDAPVGARLLRVWSGEDSEGERMVDGLSEDGRFSFEGLRPGRWELAIAFEGDVHPAALCSLELAPGEALDLGELGAPGDRGSVVVRLGAVPAATSRFLTVVARHVSVQSYVLRGVVVGDGLWRIDGLVVGQEYAIGCSSWDLIAPTVRVVLSPGDPATVDLPIPDTCTVLEITQDDDSIELGVVELRIYDARSGDLLCERTWVGSLRQRAHMAVGEYRYEVRTGAGLRGDGWFRVEEPSDGEPATVLMPVTRRWK